MSHQVDIEFLAQLPATDQPPLVADIGCGPNKFPGATGVDIVRQPGVDIVHDLDSYPWPLDDARYDVVICNHLVEHVENLVAAVTEIHRILRPGGCFIARTPHYSHVDSYVDPTHRRHLTTASFDYFVDGCSQAGLYTPALFAKDAVSLSFGNGLFSQMGRLLARISMRQYEKYWCRLFPANTLYFRLTALKQATP